MNSASIRDNLTLGNLTLSGSATRSAEGQINQDVVLPAAVVGAISAAAGVDGLAGGHGFVHADVVDVHWEALGVRRCRRGLVVDASAANSITFAGGAPEGDALPAEDTAVTVAKRIAVAAAWSGDLTVLLAVVATRDCELSVRGAAAAAVKTMHLTSNVLWKWLSDTEDANPLAAAAISALWISNAEAVVGTLKLVALYSSVT